MREFRDSKALAASTTTSCAGIREFRGDQQDRNYYTNLLGVMQDGRPFLKPENLKNGNAFLNIANAKYYLIRQGESLYKIQNEGALPRISYVPGYVVMDSSRIETALKTGGYDYRAVVALLTEPAQKPPVRTDSLSSGQAAVEWLTYTPNYRKAKVTSFGNGFLRISDVYYPGWKIEVDGKPVPIYRADLAWMAVNIAKGEHTVEMIPQSLYLKMAEVVSFPLMVLLGVVLDGNRGCTVYEKNKAGVVSFCFPRGDQALVFPRTDEFKTSR